MAIAVELVAAVAHARARDRGLWQEGRVFSPRYLISGGCYDGSQPRDVGRRYSAGNGSWWCSDVVE